jgi:putative oxidoreductase
VNNPAIPLALARLLMALMFLIAGIDKLSNPAGTAGWIGSLGLPMPMLMTVAAGLVEVGAGLLLVLGWKARWAALALAVFTLAASLLFHSWWSMPAEQQMTNQLFFLKNLAVIGGLLFVFVFGAGSLSLDARKTHA